MARRVRPFTSFGARHHRRRVRACGRRSWWSAGSFVGPRTGGAVAITDEVEHPYRWMREEHADARLGFVEGQIGGFFRGRACRRRVFRPSCVVSLTFSKLLLSYVV